MRILLINFEYPPIGGGAATATAELARAATVLGHQVTVLTSGFGEMSGWAQEEGIKVCRVRSRRERPDRTSVREMASFVSRAALVMPSVIRLSRAESCIAFFSMPCGPLGLLFRLLSRQPYAVSIRGGDVPGNELQLARMHRLLKAIRRMALRKAMAHCVGRLPRELKT